MTLSKNSKLQVQSFRNSELKFYTNFVPLIRVVGSNHDEEFTVEELKEMAAKGCPLSRMKLKELEEDGIIEPDYKQLESMASQGCPMAKAKLAKLAGKIFLNKFIYFFNLKI